MDDDTKILLQESLTHYYRDVLGLSDWKHRTERRLAHQFEHFVIECLCDQAGSLKEKNLLDVGCGWGGLLHEAMQKGACGFGIEPDFERVRISRRIFPELKGEFQQDGSVACGIGEALPFPSDFFDIVCCYEVLEHVYQPELVVAEIARVLKPCGSVHIMIPNPLVFYESHYKIFWVPFMPKRLARLYLHLLGRNTSFLEQIHTVTAGYVLSMLKKAHLRTVNVTIQRRQQNYLEEIDPRRLSLWKRLKLFRLVVSLALFMIRVHAALTARNIELYATKEGFPVLETL